jgi:ATP-dependent Clp protease adaptor protein ClpS
MPKKHKQSLYIINDNMHSFNDVMMVLEMLLGFNTIQAEQIALLVHYKGKYPVMSADIETLKDFEYMLLKHGLNVMIK